MGMLNVQVWDATGNKRQEVEMPDDAPINRILAVLLEKMKFPQFAPDGQPLSYKFHHRASGKQMLDTQTLAEVGVKEGDVLRLQPEITAGHASCLRAFSFSLETFSGRAAPRPAPPARLFTGDARGPVASRI